MCTPRHAHTHVLPTPNTKGCLTLPAQVCVNMNMPPHSEFSSLPTWLLDGGEVTRGSIMVNTTQPRDECDDGRRCEVDGGRVYRAGTRVFIRHDNTAIRE